MQKMFITRKLEISDAEKIVALDSTKWEKGAVTIDQIVTRLSHIQHTSWGCFDTDGNLYATLFLMRKDRNVIIAAKDWFEITDDGKCGIYENYAHHLFGVSLTSILSVATAHVFDAAYDYCEKEKIKSVLLGSPVPGFSKWRRKNKNHSLSAYVEEHKKNVIDPQLKFYSQNGFDVIVAAKENYFPHAASMNNGVIIERVLIP